MTTKQQRITYHYHCKGLKQTYHPVIGKDGELKLSVLTPDNIYSQYPLYEDVEDGTIDKLCDQVEQLLRKELVGVIAIKYNVDYLATPGEKLKEVYRLVI
ncbi:hypothetical protein FDI90_gp075 [Pseudomonas phage PA7]|uniref:Uncharacterized protein n=1 Tax=Pseudomonas phage PA7 TaxID=347330 RepID=I7CNB5_9CAUD|nr:hypothetical protein FDI90_gp075 [Pseudomonas phage PA7]AFO70882.1 hypothetical protein [Pseudomonas phage PA7]